MMCMCKLKRHWADCTDMNANLSIWTWVEKHFHLLLLDNLFILILSVLEDNSSAWSNVVLLRVLCLNIKIPHLLQSTSKITKKRTTKNTLLSIADCLSLLAVRWISENTRLTSRCAPYSLKAVSSMIYHPSIKALIVSIQKLRFERIYFLVRKTHNFLGLPT